MTAPARDAAPREPERLGTRRDEGAIEDHLRVPSDLAFLEGHFPGRPFVAGVVEVHFAMQALGELRSDAAAPATLEALKFHELLLPGQEARLRVEIDADGRRFRFSLVDAALAQCAAVDGSLRLRAHGMSPRPVLFVGSRRIAFHREAFDPSERLEVEARHAAGRPDGLLAFDCALYASGGHRALAEGRLNVLARSFDERSAERA